MTQGKPEDTPAAPPPSSIKAEITAMGKAYEALRHLDDDAQYRAMHWLGDRLGADRQAGRKAAGYNDEPPF